MKKGILNQQLADIVYPFRWYIGFNVLYLGMMFYAYFDVPSANDPIWGSEAAGKTWNYISQEVYIKSFRLELLIYVLLFLLGISNMKNHSKLAKIIFLFPCFHIAYNVLSMFWA